MDDFEEDMSYFRKIGKALDKREENRSLIQGEENESLENLLKGIQQATKRLGFLIQSSLKSFQTADEKILGRIDINGLEKLPEMEEFMKMPLEKPERSETPRTVTEWLDHSWRDGFGPYSFYCGDNEQEWPAQSDPPYLKERYSMSTTPGLKFQPTDKEAILHLQKKHSNPCQTPSWSPIKDCTDLYGTQPGHLPDANSIKEKEALYYYVPTKKKSGNGDRIGPNGYWRASGNKNILSETGSEIGYRRTLKYFEYPDENQKSSKFGKSTNWMMHEYRLATTTGSQSQEESLEHWTICKVTWTGKNIKVTNDFGGEGSIGPSENKNKNEFKMHIQNEGDLKISKIVDSKQEQIAQTNCHFIGDEFRRWTKEIRGKLTEQRMNREIHQSEEVTPCHASGINSTLMATMHEVETKGVEPQQFENPEKITKEFGTYISEQTSASWFDQFLNSDFTGRKDEIQSRIDPSISEQTFASWFDQFLNSDFTGRKDEIQSQIDPSISEQTPASWGDCFLNPDVIGSSDEIQF